MNAWLLTWEGTVGPALNQDEKVIAILSGRRKTGSIEDAVDLLYCRSVDTAFDMSRAANKKRERMNQYRHVYSQWNRVFYGRNPCIYARLVSNLKIAKNEESGTETLAWIDPPYLKIDSPGEMPYEAEPPVARTLIRRLKPLSHDLHK